MTSLQVVTECLVPIKYWTETRFDAPGFNVGKVDGHTQLFGPLSELLRCAKGRKPTTVGSPKTLKQSAYIDRLIQVEPVYFIPDIMASPAVGYKIESRSSRSGVYEPRHKLVPLSSGAPEVKSWKQMVRNYPIPSGPGHSLYDYIFVSERSIPVISSESEGGFLTGTGNVVSTAPRSLPLSALMVHSDSGIDYEHIMTSNYEETNHYPLLDMCGEPPHVTEPLQCQFDEGEGPALTASANSSTVDEMTTPYGGSEPSTPNKPRSVRGSSTPPARRERALSEERPKKSPKKLNQAHVKRQRVSKSIEVNDFGYQIPKGSGGREVKLFVAKNVSKMVPDAERKMVKKSITLTKLHDLIKAPKGLQYGVAKRCLQAQHIDKVFAKPRALVYGEQLYRTLPESYLLFSRNNLTKGNWEELYSSFPTFPLLYSYPHIMSAKKLFQVVRL